MNFLKKKIDIRSIIITLLIFEVFLIYVAYFIIGPSELVDFDSILIILFQGSLFYYLIKYRSDKYNLIISLIIFLIVFFYPRIFQYLVIPKYIFFPYPEHITANHLNYILILVTVLIFVLYVLTKLFEFKNFEINLERILGKTTSVINLKSLLLIFIAIIIFEISLINVFNLNYSSSISTNKYHYILMFFRNIFGGDVFIMLILTIVFNSKINHKWKLYFLIHFIYLLLMTYQGSKGAILRNDFILLFHLIFYQNYKIRLQYLIIFFILNFTIGPSLYLTNELIRKNDAIADVDKIRKITKDNLTYETYVYNLQEFDKSSSGKIYHDNYINTFLKLDFINLKDLKDFLSFNLNMSESYFNSDFYNSDLSRLNVISKLLNRLGIIDYPLLISKANSKKEILNKNVIEDYKYQSLFYRVVNQVLPGNPYKNHKFSESRLVPNLVMNYSKESIEKYFNTEPTTIWGSAISYEERNFIKSVIFIFIFYLITLILMFAISRYFGGYILNSMVFLFYTSSFFGSYAMYGLDGHIVKLIIMSIQCISFTLLYFSLSVFLKKKNENQI